MVGGGAVRAAGRNHSLLPPRVLTFSYSDHRPRATCRAVRTSGYITSTIYDTTKSRIEDLC